MFDNESFVDVRSDFIAGRCVLERTFHLLGINAHPARETVLAGEFESFDNTNLLLGGLANGDHITSLNGIGRDVALLTVDEDGAVAHELTSFSTRGAEAHAVNNVVEAAFQQSKQDFAGVAGAAASTLAVCLPSFAVIYLISLFFDRFLQLTVVANAFKGIQACVIYLILSAGVKMLKNLQRTPFNTAVVAVVLAVMVGCSVLAVKFSSICCILFCGAAGVLAYAVGQGKKGGTK